MDLSGGAPPARMLKVRCSQVEKAAANCCRANQMINDETALLWQSCGPSGLFLPDLAAGSRPSPRSLRDSGVLKV